jgi:hypothetical protein
MERGGCSERRGAGPADPRADQENLASYANGVLAGALPTHPRMQQKTPNSPDGIEQVFADQLDGSVSAICPKWYLLLWKRSLV